MAKKVVLITALGKEFDCFPYQTHDSFVRTMRKVLGIPSSVAVEAFEVGGAGVIVDDIVSYIRDERLKEVSVKFGVSWQMPVFIGTGRTAHPEISVEVNSIDGIDADFESRVNSAKIAYLTKKAKKEAKGIPSTDGLTHLFCNADNTSANREKSAALKNGLSCLRFVEQKGYSGLSLEDIRPFFHFLGFSKTDLPHGHRFESAFNSRKAVIMETCPLFEANCKWVQQYLLCIADLIPSRGTNEAFRRLLINPVQIAAASCISADSNFITRFCESTGTIESPKWNVSVACPTQFAVEYHRPQDPDIHFPVIGSGPLDYRLKGIVTGCNKEPALKKQRIDEESEVDDDEDLVEADSNLDNLTSAQVDQCLSYIQILEAKTTILSGQWAQFTKSVCQLGAQMHDELQCLEYQRSKGEDEFKGKAHIKGILSTGQHYLFFIAHIHNGKKVLQYLGRTVIDILREVSNEQSLVGRPSGGAKDGVSLEDVKELVALLIFFAQFEVTDDSMNAMIAASGASSNDA